MAYPQYQQTPVQYAPQPMQPRYPTYAPQVYGQPMPPQYPYYPQYAPTPVEQMQAAIPPAPPSIEDRVAALEQEIRQLKEALGGE